MRVPLFLRAVWEGATTRGRGASGVVRHAQPACRGRLVSLGGTGVRGRMVEPGERINKVIKTTPPAKLLVARNSLSHSHR